jgi:hypothetical protein
MVDIKKYFSYHSFYSILIESRKYLQVNLLEIIMKTQSFLGIMLFFIGAMSFASGGAYTTVGSLAGNAIVNQEAIFKVKYKWLSSGERSGKVFYAVAGTDCKGEVDIDRHSGLLPVAGELDIKCTFNQSAVFKSDTVLQLYAGAVKKEVSEHQSGQIIVTAK